MSHSQVTIQDKPERIEVMAVLYDQEGLQNLGHPDLTFDRLATVAGSASPVRRIHYCGCNSDVQFRANCKASSFTSRFQSSLEYYFQLMVPAAMLRPRYPH